MEQEDVMSAAFVVARSCSENYGHDLQKAKAEANKRVRKLPEFERIVDALLSRAIGDMVEQCRHEANRQIKKAAGMYGGPAKVVSSKDEGVQRAFNTVYDLMIGGTRLGYLHGRDLAGIMESEFSAARGHSENAHICRLLQPLVPEDKTVRECVTEKKLKAIFAKAKELTAA